MTESETFPMDVICAYCFDSAREMVGHITTCGAEVCVKEARREVEPRTSLADLLARYGGERG